MIMHQGEQQSSLMNELSAKRRMRKIGQKDRRDFIWFHRKIEDSVESLSKIHNISQAGHYSGIILLRVLAKEGGNQSLENEQKSSNLYFEDWLH